MVESLNQSGLLPYELVWKPTLITNELIRKTFNEANADEECVGVITRMYTAVGIMESSHIRVVRVTDNMGNVAVIVDDRVEA